MCLYFSTGCRFSNLDPGQADSPCCSPPDSRFPHCFDHKRGGTLLCPVTEAQNSSAWGAAGWTSLAAGAQRTALAAGSPTSVYLSSLGHRWARGWFSEGAGTARRQGRQDKHLRSQKDWRGCCSANSNQKIILLILFWLVYPLLMFFSLPTILEKLMYIWLSLVDPM